ncbi:hypothetical protein H0H92_005707 [Tricholoma furcatifolium]|nr:hypothetical protein H0H92_005707 [Tricholoma furcatifolium]
MASLEPPSRPYVLNDVGRQPDSASTSITNFEMSEAENSSQTVDYRAIEALSHEPAQEVSSTMEEKVDEPSSNSAEPQVPQTPQVYLTFLVISGRRKTMSFEPETTIGRVKELVWSSWPADWEDERPAGPSFLRVLYLGRMLQDDETLLQINFPTHTPQSNPAPTPTIVHISVRPFAPPGETELKKKRKSRQSGDLDPDAPSGAGDEGSSAGCCGCIIC